MHIRKLSGRNVFVLIIKEKENYRSIVFLKKKKKEQKKEKKNEQETRT